MRSWRGLAGKGGGGTVRDGAVQRGGKGKEASRRASGADSAQMRPPWRISTRRTLARPMPVPAKSLALCRRWNTPNSLPAYAMSKPAPLSRTVNRWPPSALRSCPTSMVATSRRALYLTALPSRFSHTWRIMFSSATSMGSGAMRQSMRRSGWSACALAVQHGAGLGHQRLHVHRLQAHRAAAQARIHQQVVDQRRHAAGGTADHVQVMAALLVGVLAQVAAPACRRSRRCGAAARAGRGDDRVAEGLQFAVDVRAPGRPCPPAGG